ncbi:MAG TPA: hypothetical protein VIO14_08410 [Dehalococcoidia bacterium]
MSAEIMQSRMSEVQMRISGVAQSVGPVVAVVVAALLIIFGILVIAFPELLAWVVGIGLIVGGVALLATVFTTTARG